MCGYLPVRHLFPYVASNVAVAVVWNFLFRDIGPINNFLMRIGISNPPGWTASTTWVMNVRSSRR